MSDNEKHKIFIDYLKNTKPRSKKHRVLSQENFSEGKVANVEYFDGDSKLDTWVIITKDSKSDASSTNDLIQKLESARVQNSNTVKWYDQFFNMSGFIALCLIVPFIYLTIVSPEGNVPDALQSLVLMVNGFYFGGATASTLGNKS